MSKAPLFIGAGVVLALLAGLLLLSGAEADARLEQSALGVSGIARLAPELGLKLEVPRRITPLKASDLSLRILPLYDLDLIAENERPKNRLEELGQTTLREMNYSDFDAKLWQMETLVVLPKWRGGVVVTGVANAVFLITPPEFSSLIPQVGLFKSQIQQADAVFVPETVDLNGISLSIALFHAQTFARKNLPEHCRELAGTNAGALLIRCTPTEDMPAISYLSDPDILNTHGLTKARNADFIVAMIKALQKKDETRPVYLDTSSDNQLAAEEDAEAQYYERDTDQLLRFFAWPLSLLWWAACAVFGVAIWRGAKRFGPVKRLPEDRLEISKLAAIDAKARLIRLSRNDGRMVAEFVQSRLQRLADHTFGATSGAASVERLFEKLDRQNPEGAGILRARVTTLQQSAGQMSPPDLRRNLEQFKDILERLTHGPA